jgi:hypothetical protein
MGKSRSERRHHHNRMLDKVKNFWWLKSKFWHGTEEERDLHLKKVAENRQKCSCHVCGNPRKYWKEETMQEKRIKEYERYEE